MPDLRRILSLAILTFCALIAHSQEILRIAAAADLQPVLPPILVQFAAQTGIRPEASYKASATLATAIINGAPFDLFLAADLSFPQKVIAAGLAAESAPIPYARGTLVLWTRNDSRFHQLSTTTLSDPSLKSIAIANPDHAPYGRAAVTALEHLGLYDALKPKLVIAENIAQAAQYVSSGNADLGLISLTSALELDDTGRYIPIPRQNYPPILQGAIVVKNSMNEQAAHKFLDFLASPVIVHQLQAAGLSPSH